MATTKDWTVREAAKALGVTAGRVRQLVIQYDLGTLFETEVGTTYRILTDAEVEFLRRRKDGRKKTA